MDDILDACWGGNLDVLKQCITRENVNERMGEYLDNAWWEEHGE
jgi:hypothetical protein